MGGGIGEEINIRGEQASDAPEWNPENVCGLPKAGEPTLVLPSLDNYLI